MVQMNSNGNKSEISDLILQLSIFQKELDEYVSERYFNSQSIISIKAITPIKKIDFYLSDILLIGAITQSSLLLSGSSGSGKTFLAETVNSFLFGNQGYSRKNITPDMNEQDFMDIDFGAIKEGKKLKEAMLADELFNRSALIIDEANRAPPIIQNRLMQILENNIDLKSKTIRAGKKLENGNYYHWNILTLNLGEEYAGTSTVDRALRDRIAIDIPIDNFPPTLDDQIQMIRESPISKDNIEPLSQEDLIFKIYQNLNDLPLSIEAEALILYLSFASNCVKSPTGSKYGVLFSPQFCKDKDCPYARNPPLNKICPFSFAPSNRVLRRLVQVSKGFCLLRHAKTINILQKRKKDNLVNKYLKTIENWEVTLDDVISIAPFVLHSNISMNQEWVFNNFNGSTYLACKFFLKVIHERLIYFMKNILIKLVEENKGVPISEKDIGIRKKAIKEDFHFNGLIKYVKKYLG